MEMCESWWEQGKTNIVLSPKRLPVPLLCIIMSGFSVKGSRQRFGRASGCFLQAVVLILVLLISSSLHRSLFFFFCGGGRGRHRCIERRPTTRNDCSLGCDSLKLLADVIPPPHCPPALCTPLPRRVFAELPTSPCLQTASRCCVPL